MMSDLFDTPAAMTEQLDLPGLMQRVAAHSARPRYTFTVLGLIARVAEASGWAGPHVRDGTALVPIREWLAGALAPAASRHHRRIAAAGRVRAGLAARGALPADAAAADAAVAAEMAERVRESGKTAVSRAVSELVAAGLIQRHYQGDRVDHLNRGAQRMAVYIVPADVRAALGSAVGVGGRRPRLL